MMDERVVTGELADRCRAALGVDDPTAGVIITEHVTQRAWSDVTFDDWTDIEVECAGKWIEFDRDSSDRNTFDQLLDWLDEHS